MFLLFSSIKTQNDKTTTECNDNNENCEQCITGNNCQFIIWKSDIKNKTHTRCVNITLSEDGVKKQGPYGNHLNDTHWKSTLIHDKTKCSVSVNLPKGNNLYVIFVRSL